MLNADHLHQQASRRADGLSDFGSPDYQEGLGVLLDAARTSPYASPPLSDAVASLTTDVLYSRLQSQAGWTSGTAWRDHVVQRPLIVIGLPRSGTTALHQLLSTDPQFQWIPQWLADAPAPRPPRELWPEQPRYRVARAERERLGANALHDVGPDDAQECINVMVQSFTSMMFVSSLPVPDYHEWFLAQDERPSYRRFVANLKLMGGQDARPWLLKNPSHVFGLDALLEVMPDARIAWIHRDPVESIPSGCSLIMKVGGGKLGFPPDELGRHRLRIWSLAYHRARLARESRPGEQFCDIAYDAFVADPAAQIRDIYQHFGLEHTDAVAASVQHWLRDNPQGKHGTHAYSPGDFGLTAAQIRAAF